MVARVVSDARCPGALHAVDARDGLLARIRVPGGCLSNDALRELADLCERDADGALDITARANVQVRGLSNGTLERFGASLLAAGLVTSRSHERVRNIVASAFAGFDADERVDVRPVVRAFDRLLAAAADLADLPAKFVVAIDGGGFPIDRARADLALVARRCDDGERFALWIGGVDAGVSVAISDGAELLVAAARAALAHAHDVCGPDDRRWRLARLSGARESIVADVAALRIVAHPVAHPASPVRARSPRGIRAANRPDRANVVPSVPLGRLSAAQARALARLADRAGAEVRLGTWRGVALVGVARDALARLADELARCGLPLDGRDGFDGVAACAGTSGCASSFADVRAHAVAYAARVARDRATRRDAQTLNISGCEKRCAMRAGADIDFIARAGGYDVVVRGALVATAVSSEAALERACIEATRG